MARLVRVCDEKTVHECTGLAREFYNHMPQSHRDAVEFDYEHASMWARWAYSQEDFFLLLLYDDNDTPAGMIVGYVSMLPYSFRKIGSEQAWFVREGTPFRAKWAKALMISFMEWCHREHNVVDISPGSSAFNIAAGDALLRQLGFKRCGVTFSLIRGVTQ